MKLIAKKPCSFNGRKYFIGDEIPEADVSDAERQEQLGVLSAVQDGAVPDTKETAAGSIEISVLTEDGEGDATFGVTQEEMQKVLDIMQMNADDAAAAIDQVSDDKVLIIIHAADCRSTVKKAAKKRAELIS